MKGPGYIEEDRTKDKVHVGVSINTGSWRDPSMNERIELKRIRCVCHHVITNTLRRRFLLLLGWSWKRHVLQVIYGYIVQIFIC